MMVWCVRGCHAICHPHTARTARRSRAACSTVYCLCSMQRGCAAIAAADRRADTPDHFCLGVGTKPGNPLHPIPTAGTPRSPKTGLPTLNFFGSARDGAGSTPTSARAAARFRARFGFSPTKRMLQQQQKQRSMQKSSDLMSQLSPRDEEAASQVRSRLAHAAVRAGVSVTEVRHQRATSAHVSRALAVAETNKARSVEEKRQSPLRERRPAWKY